MLLILAGVTIAQLTGNGILNKAQTASDETNKSQATEAMNLKITNIQISSYAETQKLPNLQYLADKLCEDNDIQYVLTASKEHANLAETDTKPKIDVTNFSSIFTKLKEYPYEFEINSSLQLASIDGIKIATVPSNNDETIVSMTKAELNSYIENIVNTKLQDYSKTTDINSTYATKDELTNSENSISITKLWSEPIAKTSGSITLSDDITNYKFLIVNSGYTGTSNKNWSTTIMKDDFVIDDSNIDRYEIDGYDTRYINFYFSSNRSLQIRVSNELGLLSVYGVK